MCFFLLHFQKIRSGKIGIGSGAKKKQKIGIRSGAIQRDRDGHP